MFKTGGFWADESSPREHCYSIVPLRIAHDAREMTLNGFNLVYQALGNLGYLFRDAGHDSKKVVVSLNKPIIRKHLRELEGTLSIDKDSGLELSFI